MTDDMEAAYREVRLAIKNFELAIERAAFRSEGEEKSADKALVVMKVGAKLLKRIVRARGIKGRLKDWPREPDFMGFHKP